jgi:hypothetical protein
MPRRSNDFQRLIKRIYEQLAGTTATVSESALVAEHGTDCEREIDVLIEAQIASVVLRVAVECRDRARPADVTWIDELEGKFRNLGIDKVIAVARSGFSAGAASKAAMLGIETQTLSEGLETDWPKQLARPRVWLQT